MNFLTSSYPRAEKVRLRGFTLVEIMVSLAVLTILLLISAQVIGQVQSTWSASNARVSQFREARVAFDILSRNISQATLNTYIDYDSNYLATAASAGASAAPSNYVRRSELQFICGPASTLVTSGGGPNFLPGHAVFFQAPLGVTSTPAFSGLDRLLCARGYFVQFSSDKFWRPNFLPPGNERFRYRLMEYSPPTELNTVYAYAAQNAGNLSSPLSRNWFSERAGVVTNAAQSAAGAIMLTRPVADNIIALIISPRRELKNPQEVEAASGPTQIAADYTYDSSERDNIGYAPSPQGTQHLLPPLVRIVLIAVDEKSADMLSMGSGGGATPPLGTTVSGTLSQAHNLEAEVQEIVKQLNQKRLNYRVFSSTIQLRGSKWSI
jgi:uncharacterized protein (TIGR02599 family)